MRVSILILLFFKLSTLAQNPISEAEKEFAEFAEQEKKAFDDYKQKENEAISAFLKDRWQAYERMNATPYPFKPVPIEIPKTIPEPIEQPDANKLPIIFPNKEATGNPKVNHTPENVEEENSIGNQKGDPNISDTKDLSQINKEKENEVKLTFHAETFSLKSNLIYYGTTIPIGYEKDLLVHCNSPDENGVSEYWQSMSKKNYWRLTGQIEWLRAKYKLNDWGTYNLVKLFSETIMNDRNDQICFQFFFMNQLSYDIRLAKSGNELVLLIPFKEMTYAMSYLELNNKKFYITKETNSSFYTFNKNLMKDQKDISLLIDQPILFTEAPEKKQFKLKSGKEITVEYSLHMVEFLKGYPQAELDVLFNSNPSSILSQSLIQQLSPLLSGMNEWEAVNFLLEFVQHQFSYKTDAEQFGKEKWFFPEDQLHYPYSDCEDRSVFFAYLVKKLLQLDVIGLNYPEHVATAIHFHGNVKGDKVTYKGKTYSICDPTYIGASAGMCMPQFKSVKPKVIEVTKD